MSTENGTKIKPGTRRAYISAGRFVAEAGSIATSFGAIYAAEKLAPHQVEDFKNYVAKRIVKPRLAMFETVADAMPTLEGEEGQDERRQMTPDEKAKQFASALVDFSIMGTAGILGQVAIQKLCNHKLGLGKLENENSKMMMAALADRGVQLGAIGMMNTMAVQPTQALQETVAKNVMKKIGVKDDDDAMSRAKYLVNWQLPNALGMVGSLLMQDRYYAQHYNHR